MDDIVDDNFEPAPPSPERVAARALVLSAVSCRALIEKDAGKDGAEELRQEIFPWLELIGAASEMEAAETALVATPLGKLAPEKARNSSWQSEGMAVLAWALSCAELPPVHIQCEPADIANAMGFLDNRENTPMHNPRLRDAEEIRKWADTYLTFHWRLRLLESDPGPKNFVSCVATCTWGSLRLDMLELVDNDIAIEGVRVDKVDYDVYRKTISIVQERHQAFNWLLGFATVYSSVTTDT
jgi:hypothetical protein